MGCSNSKEQLENEMMELQIKRLEVQMDRYNQIRRLSQIENKKLSYTNIIPDYIDPKFAREKKNNSNDNNNNRNNGKRRTLIKNINRKKSTRNSKIKVK